MSTAAPLLATPLPAVKAHPASSGARAATAATATKTTLHLIGSAHLDPVWLWDWREGMNEGIATCRAISAMLREFPEFRFIRGEAAVYDTIERHAPDLFDEIREHVAAGRWDIVGGNWIQPDTNLPSTEALLRQFVRGKHYFREKFGVEVTSAWAADSFGHSAGLPDILAAAGMDSFAFTRPQQKILPLRQQAFWWRGRSGARILAYRPHDGWYASERADIGKRLDACLARAETEGLQTVAMFYGLGNHGGGPSRAHLREIRAWADEHPEVRVKHSGLHDLFADLRAELAWRGDDFIDTHEGELNFCLRGCSASVARFKYAYRRAESALLRAERTAAICGAGVSPAIFPEAGETPAPRQTALASAWDTLLFNAFHDILPGTAIERAYDDQLAQIGSVLTTAQRAETAALTALASRIDTRAGAWPVPDDHPLPQPVLVWNPHPWSLRKHIEVEVALDYRPVWAYSKNNDKSKAPVAITDAATGKPLPLQLIHEENDSMVDLLWRRRAVVPVEIPPMGWTLLQMGLDPLGSGAGVPPAPVRDVPKSGRDARATPPPTLVTSAQVGSPAIHFTRRAPDGTSAPWLPAGLQVRLYADTWGAWGGMNEEPDSWLLTNELERLTISDTVILETGPLRHATWVRFTGQNHRSTLELTLYTTASSEHRVASGEHSPLPPPPPHIELRARALLADRGVRMKLVIPATGANGEAEFAVPGGTIRRAPCGEVPGGRWVRAGAEGMPSAVGFASNALYGFDTTQDEFRATIARTSRYGSDVNRAPTDRPWQPCADLGEHLFRAILTPDHAALPRLADELEEPPVILTVPSHSPATSSKLQANSSQLPVHGSLLSIDHPALRLLALTPISGGALELRLQNTSDIPLPAASLRFINQPLALGSLASGEIGTWNLHHTNATDKWLSTLLVPGFAQPAMPDSIRTHSPRT
ncbi:alpha-mannosidase [Geminisphaera colitermitum]|uniref:glycoside hydrolase family 38 N-terminal domain-containing protein n=1 Tax=Geminisphaera colitermitum TaxID=1148786 RepID=UPI0009E09BEF|nr:alpha-mannosidase [Geminisphaera colitermitum]